MKLSFHGYNHSNTFLVPLAVAFIPQNCVISHSFPWLLDNDAEINCSNGLCMAQCEKICTLRSFWHPWMENLSSVRCRENQCLSTLRWKSSASSHLHRHAVMRCIIYLWQALRCCEMTFIFIDVRRAQRKQTWLQHVQYWFLLND